MVVSFRASWGALVCVWALLSMLSVGLMQVQAAPSFGTIMYEARHEGHEEAAATTSAPSDTASAASTTPAAVQPMPMHDAAASAGHMHGHEDMFTYDTISPDTVPRFCKVATAAEKVGHDELAECIAMDEVDALMGADQAGWALRPSPPISMANVHAHAHGSEAPMLTLNETRLFLRKGAVPMSYVEWDFGSGMGRMSELRRFVSDDAAQVQMTWPDRPVIGRSGGYWRTLGDLDYPVAWNSLREDLKYRIGDGKNEPTRQRGLAALTTFLFIMACFVILPLLLCLQSAQSSLVPLMSLLYLAVLTSSVLFGRLYFALSPALYPPSALPGLVRTVLFLSYACFGYPAMQLLFLIVPLVHGRLRSWSDVQNLMRVITRGPTPMLQESVPMTPTPATSSGSPSNQDNSVMFDHEEENDNPLLSSPAEDGMYVPHMGSSSFEDAASSSLRRPWDQFVHKYPRLYFTLSLMYTGISRAIVPLAFVVVYVAIAIYTGSCRRPYKNVCLAHGIKGGIFFWYGVLSFARYLGAFGEYGWAWNKRPTVANTRHSHAPYWRRTMPSGEFIECSAIFLYGITNTWMERMGAKAGDPYTIKQIQHISIAVMFWFVGLVGMALESTTVRHLLAYAVTLGHPSAVLPRGDQDRVSAQVAPPSYVSSFNPFPALVIGVTGVAMAAHHQDYVYEVEIHILWGQMLAAFGFLRCLTYFFLWVRPPTSVLPSRPPTEAIGSFALCCGGLLFMLSNEEVSFAAMRADYADGMAVLNLAVSIVGLVFAWTFFVMLVKALSVKRKAEYAMDRPEAMPSASAPNSAWPKPGDSDVKESSSSSQFVVGESYELESAL